MHTSTKVAVILGALTVVALAQNTSRATSSVDSAKELCGMIYGNYSASECGATSRMTVDARMNFTGADAKSICSHWSQDAQKKGVYFNSGWALRLVDAPTSAVVAKCPL